MRTLREQTEEAAELAEIRHGLDEVIKAARLLISRVDRLRARQTGLPLPRALEAAPEEPETSGAALPVQEPEEPPEPKEERPRSVGRFGEVFYETAKRKAEVMGEFTGMEFSKALGLKVSDTMRWLTMLVSNEVIAHHSGSYRTVEAPSVHMWVINQGEDNPFTLEQVADITRMALEDAQEELDILLDRKIITTVNGSGTYQYVEPGTHFSPNSRPRRLPPERERPSYSDAKATGEPVRRSAASRTTRRQRSTEGAGGIKGHKQRDRRYNELKAAQDKRAAEQSAKDKAKYQPKQGRKKRGSIPV